MLWTTLLLICIPIIANCTSMSSKDFEEEVKRYRATLLALHHKVESVVNLEWRINTLEATLGALEERTGGSKGHEGQGQMPFQMDYDEDYSEKMEEPEKWRVMTYEEVNRTISEALSEVQKVQVDVNQMSQKMVRLSNDVKSLDEWRQDLLLEDYGSHLNQITEKVAGVESLQQKLNTSTHQLQIETHDLRGDVSSVNEWVIRLKDEVEVIRDNVTQIAKELQKPAPLESQEEINSD